MGALNSDWLDGETLAQGGEVNSGGAMTVGNCTMTTYPATTTPTYAYYPYVYTTTSRPIRLSMSEVEKLRKAAKADDTLKAILKKFTAQIEVVVEF